MGVDVNAIMSAIEVLEAGSLVPICPRDLRCSMSPNGVVTGTWSPAQNVALGGYELRRNDEVIALLDAAATQFTDSPPCRRATTYEVVPLAPGGGPACPDLRLLCTIVQPDCPFEAPLRINMGGLQMVDSQGRVWLGDPGEGADVLNLRPNDTSGSHAIEYFSGNQGNDSFPPLGLDPNSLADRYIFNTIRWNQLDLAPSFRMEIPLDIAVYKVDMYFNEGCCPQRHFKIALQDSVVQSDVSNPIPGRVRRDSFSDIHVTNTLKIELTPCLDPECPGGGDPNPIVNAIEIVATGEHPTLQLAGDCTQDGTRDLGDVICMIGHQFPGFFLLTRTRPSLPCVGEPASGPGNGVVLDVNNDTRFDVSDIVSLAQYAVMGSPPPALGLDCLIPASSLGCFNPACY
jgi:hypothetical protein